MNASVFTRFYRELKRRKVIRVVLVYPVVAWVVVEIASVMFPGLLLPEWTVRFVIGLAILGYPIALVLAWAFQLTPDGLQLDTAESKPLKDNAADEIAKKPGEQRIDSIAVLPFLNLSNDPDNEYFSDGMAEELLNLLCKLPQLTVASRTSSFSFKGKDVDMGTVAEKLCVDAILEGSVRRSENRVRITAQLIDATSDRHIWSETYDRELKDVFAVQDEIAQNIMRALEISLSPDQERIIKKRAATRDMDAYDFYLRGRHFVERGDIDSGEAMFEKAIALDDGYALAWAGIADCHSWRCSWYGGSDESLRKADECSLKALQIAPDLAEAHASRSYALSMNSRYAEAETEFKTAISINPQLYEAYYYAGRSYFAEGKFQLALMAFTQAASIRPDDLAVASLRSTTIKKIGTEAEIREVAEQAMEVAERYLALNPDDALALSRVAVEIVSLGQIEKGLDMARRAYSISPDICRYNVACAFMLANETDKALDLLEKHARLGAVFSKWLEKDVDWDKVRGEERFEKILEMTR